MQNTYQWVCSRHVYITRWFLWFFLKLDSINMFDTHEGIATVEAVLGQLDAIVIQIFENYQILKNMFIYLKMYH